jgi:hypothetical protein
MNLGLSFYLISGVSVGIEYVRGDDDHLPSVVVDLLIIRFIFSKEDE